MKQNKEQMIQDLTKLFGLTRTGILKMHIYPIEALQHAFEVLQSKRALKKPFGFFCTVLNKYAQDNNIDIDFLSFYRNLKAEGIDKNTPDCHIIPNLTQYQLGS